MINLIIDTTRKQLLLALLKDKDVLLKSNIDSHSKHSNYLMNEISNIFDKADLKISDIDNIITLNGPGSFTGIRVGVTISKTLCWALNKNLFVVNNLEALRLSTSNDVIVSVIPDKDNNSYVGIYHDDKKIEGYLSIEDDRLNIENKSITIISNEDSVFLRRLSDMLSKNNVVNVSIIDEYNYDNLVDYALSLGPINPHLAKPIYFKKIDAEKNVN